MPAPNGPQFKMPVRGVTRGDSRLPLYRQLDVVHNDPEFAKAVDEAIRSGNHGAVASKLMKMASKDRLGSHWTHDIDQVHAYSDYSEHGDNVTSIILEAHHPGHNNIMDWDNPKDDPVMRRLIGGTKEDSGFIQPEVPVRPKSPMKIKAIHIRGPVPDDPYAPDIDHRVPIDWKGTA